MTLDLPTPVANFFSADTSDSEAVAQCFTENAVVKDEGRTFKGRAAIRQWRVDASAKYQYKSEPIVCERRDGQVIGDRPQNTRADGHTEVAKRESGPSCGRSPHSEFVGVVE